MKSLELVQQIVAGRLFLASLILLTTTDGQPVEDGPKIKSEDAKVIYDQRQNGKYNIRFNIKDVAIIEMDNNDFGDDDLSEDDYYYDEEDLTVKPLKLTTPASIFHQPMTSMKSTPMLTALDFSHPHATQLPTETMPSIHNTNLLPDVQNSQTAPPEVTTQEIITVSSNSMPSFQPTQNLLESRSEYEMGTGSTAATKTKLHFKIMATAASSLPTTVHQNTQIKESEDKPDKEIFEKITTEYSEPKMFKSKKPLNFQQVKRHLRRCRTNQYLDLNGSCRNKRSTSFLKKLLNIIANIPFVVAKDVHKD